MTFLLQGRGAQSRLGGRDVLWRERPLRKGGGAVGCPAPRAARVQRAPGRTCRGGQRAPGRTCRGGQRAPGDTTLVPIFLWKPGASRKTVTRASLLAARARVWHNGRAGSFGVQGVSASSSRPRGLEELAETPCTPKDPARPLCQTRALAARRDALVTVFRLAPGFHKKIGTRVVSPGARCPPRHVRPGARCPPRHVRPGARCTRAALGAGHPTAPPPLRRGRSRHRTSRPPRRD